MKKAFITGITGQDGSYLAELLLLKGYEVHGLVRRSSTPNTSRINPLNFKRNLVLHYGDLADSEQISNVMHSVRPDEVYHLGAQSHVGVSFENPESTGNITGLSTARLLEAIRRCNPDARFYHASSSEMFGASSPPQNENTPFCPRSPYACAKLYSHWMTRNYCDGYGMFAVNGILFNHESPRRGVEFVTRKVTMGIADILSGKTTVLSLGNMDAKRDWGYSPEYVEAIWTILQQETPEDFVIGTGETHSVFQFVSEAFHYAGLDMNEHLRTDPTMYRPTDVVSLIADSGKARRQLGWVPKIKFNDLVRIMVDADMRAAGIEPLGDGDMIIEKMFPHRSWRDD